MTANDPVFYAQLGDAWYCLDAFTRTVTVLHLIAAGLEFRMSRTSHWLLPSSDSTSVSLPPSNMKPLTLKLLLCWVASFILSVTPFAWYYSSSRSVTNNLARESNLRKLVTCVALLTFVLPVTALIVVLLLTVQTRHSERYFSKKFNNGNWSNEDSVVDRLLMNASSARGGYDPKRPLSRTASGVSRRGSHRRQGSKRNKRGSTSGLGGGSKSMGGRTSPQLDRHPSLRYSIKRHRSSTSIQDTGVCKYRDQVSVYQQFRVDNATLVLNILCRTQANLHPDLT